MSSTAALHKSIFGEDSDEDGDYMPPTAAALEGDDDEEDDSRAQQILEARGNNLLVGKSAKKAKEKKAKEPTEKRSRGSGSGRSKRKADDEGGPGRKRLHKAGGGDGEDGAERPPAAEGDDPDQDSGSGSEAIEEGGKNDFDRILGALKHKRGSKQVSREKLTNDFKDMQERMEKAAEDDEEAARSDPPMPAIYKVGMLSEVQVMMRKKQYHEVLIDHGLLSTLARWLHPMEGGSLVSLELRTAILSSLLLLDVDETVLGALRSSGIGKYIRLFSLHKRETKENRRTALRLIEKWSRPIFQTSDKVQAKDLPVAMAPREPRAQREEDEPLFAPSGPQTGNHARVPRPMGMDFSMMPASSAQAMPSSKYAKDSVKGRLTDRITNGKRKVASQAVTLSVEGRTLDRI